MVVTAIQMIAHAFSFVQMRKVRAAKTLWPCALDFLAGLLFLVWAHLFIQGRSKDELTMKYLLIIADYVFFYRGIKRSNFIEGIRYHIRMIGQIMYHMSHFLTLVLFSVLLYTLVFTILKVADPTHNMLKAAFDESIDLVTMATEPMWYADPFLWVIVMIGIVVVPIVLLNLLIAIIGAEYLEFETNSVVEDWREKAALCLEIEYIYRIFNGTQNEPKLLYCISYCQDNKPKPDRVTSFVRNSVSEVENKFEK